MSDVVELKIGKRGEIYTTREVRAKAGIVPGGRAVARVEGDQLIIQPKPTALSLLTEPRVNQTPVSSEKLSELRREIARELESR